jgi:hypothetical protein
LLSATLAAGPTENNPVWRALTMDAALKISLMIKFMDFCKKRSYFFLRCTESGPHHAFSKASFWTRHPFGVRFCLSTDWMLKRENATDLRS